MLKTVLFLLATLIVVPVAAYVYDVPPTTEQVEIMKPIFYTYLGLAAACFIISTLSKNYSQVDKLWGLAPILYAWQVVYLSGGGPRSILIAVLITIWGLRLSYNFNRRGGFSWKFWSGEEDYRWAILKAKPEFQPAWKWTLFNLFFISFYQMGLIMLMTFPMIKSIGGAPISGWDVVIALLILLFIVIEYIADQQQYNFQTEKYRRINAQEDLGTYSHGFTNTGLWKYVRHPNYAAEQGIWILIYLFSISATGVWINWSIAGAILLLLLFYGSSEFSEEITESKYPAYTAYKKSTPRFIPFLSKG